MTSEEYRSGGTILLAVRVRKYLLRASNQRVGGIGNERSTCAPRPIIFTHDYALDYYLYTNLYIVLLVLVSPDSYFLGVLRLRVRTLIIGLELYPQNLFVR